ncbi:hypothetical protein BDK51DRAFT_26923, partial [Blyttiomyces helicus]
VSVTDLKSRCGSRVFSSNAATPKSKGETLEANTPRILRHGEVVVFGVDFPEQITDAHGRTTVYEHKRVPILVEYLRKAQPETSVSPKSSTPSPALNARAIVVERSSVAIAALKSIPIDVEPIIVDSGSSSPENPAEKTGSQTFKSTTGSSKRARSESEANSGLIQVVERGSTTPSLNPPASKRPTANVVQVIERSPTNPSPTASNKRARIDQGLSPQPSIEVDSGRTMQAAGPSAGVHQGPSDQAAALSTADELGPFAHLPAELVGTAPASTHSKWHRIDPPAPPMDPARIPPPSLQCVVDYPAVAPTEGRRTNMCLRVTCPTGGSAPASLPLDVVLALDVHGSDNVKLGAVREAAVATVKALRPSDRVSVVLFGRRVQVLVGLVRVGSETERLELIGLVAGISLDGQGVGPVDPDGLLKYFKIVESHRGISIAAFVGILVARKVGERRVLSDWNNSFPIHTFAVPSKPDALNLSSLSRATQGTFTSFPQDAYTTNSGSLSTSIENLLAGSRSELYRSITVSLRPINGATLTAVRSSYPTQRVSTGEWVIVLGPLWAAESRSILCTVEIPKGSETPQPMNEAPITYLEAKLTCTFPSSAPSRVRSTQTGTIHRSEPSLRDPFMSIETAYQTLRLATLAQTDAEKPSLPVPHFTHDSRDVEPHYRSRIDAIVAIFGGDARGDEALRCCAISALGLERSLVGAPWEVYRFKG